MNNFVKIKYMTEDISPRKSSIPDVDKNDDDYAYLIFRLKKIKEIITMLEESF